MSKVRLTPEFLRNTGQYTGEEPQKVWDTVECSCSMCARGQHVAVDESGIDGGYRHIAKSNLETKT